MSGLAKEHARRASADLSAWWTNKQQQPQSQPMLGRHQNAPQDTPYEVHHASTPAAPPSNRRQSSEITASSPTSTPADSARAHLHYRDQQQQQQSFVTAKDVGYGDDEKQNLQEQDELARALEVSQRETEEKTSKTAKEDDELRAALAESTRLARLNPSLAAQEQADLSKALLASQREVLHKSAPSRPPRSSAREQPGSISRSSSSTSLEESEWAIRARNEKGSLWNEAGAHGWLPPGASRAGGEDEREMEMLELAIRISLEEEEERKAREAELLAELESTTRPGLHGQMSDSTCFSSYATAPSIPSDESAHSAPRSQAPQASTNSPPGRKLPPRPTSHIITQPLSPPTSPHVGSARQPQEIDTSAPPLPPNPYYSPTTPQSSQAPPLPSRAPPSPPQSELEPSPNLPSASQLQPPNAPWTEDPERSSSPYDIPFLTSSPSIRRSGASWQPPSPVFDDDSGRHSGASYDSRTPSAGSMHSRNSLNVGYSDQEDNRGEEDPLEALTVRNPDTSRPPSRDPPPPPSSVSTTALPPFESTMTGRSLSLVSEATEPPSPSSAGADSVPSQLFGAERRASSPVRSPSLMQALQSEPPQFDSSSAEQEITQDSADDTTPPAAEPQVTFGDGVRFGYPRACAHEEDHACSLDGLGSNGPFPVEIVLSGESESEGEEDGQERSAFSVEARSWAGLLRFLMWYGETTIAAAASDIASSPHRHCDASLSLSFRHDDLGSSILRLTISLLPAHDHSHTPDPELTIASPPSNLNSNGKGKGKARAASSSPSTTYLLPDHLVLPTRLSSTAHTLYSLRHLAQIALSTQPSKHASPSYHALRSLAQSIQQLALASTRASDGGGKSGLGAGGKGQDDLVGRLRDRLKRMRGTKDAKRGGDGGGTGAIRPSSSGAKLVKIPPTEAVARTTVVRRRDRVLSVGESDEMNDAEYAEAREQEERTRLEEEQRRREEELLEHETRYLPTLGRA